MLQPNSNDLPLENKETSCPVDKGSDISIVDEEKDEYMIYLASIKKNPVNMTDVLKEEQLKKLEDEMKFTEVKQLGMGSSLGKYKSSVHKQCISSAWRDYLELISMTGILNPKLAAMH